MEDMSRHSVHIEAIRNDLNRIVGEWLHLHFRLSIVLVLISFVAECFIALFIAHSNILNTTINLYILKFIVIPSGLAILCLIAGLLILRAKRLSQQNKVYAISMLYVLICFVYYTAHSAFIAIYPLYVVAIILTTTYADYRLTGIVSSFSIISFVGSELFLRWDLDKVSIFADSNRLMDFLVALIILLGCSMIASVTIYYERRKNEASLRREVERELLKESLRFDELTGVYNRKALHDALRPLEQQGSKEPLVFGIADLDHFKDVNDRFGHQVGDLCLTEFACVLSEHFGESSIYRYGGDEFCLVLRNTTVAAAVSLCERVQARLTRVELADAPDLKLAASFGLVLLGAENGASRLFLQADEALYAAKTVRNAVCVYEGAFSPQTGHIEGTPRESAVS